MPLSVFRCGVRLPSGRAVQHVARGARVRTGSDRAGVVLLPCRWGGLCSSGGCGQGAEPLPAGQERFGPGPVGADGEDLLAGVGGQARGEVPDPVAEGVRVGVAGSGSPWKPEEAGPGGEVGGDVRRGDPPCVDLPGLRWQAAQAHGFRGADAGGLDDRVLAVHHVDVLRVVAAGDALDAGVGDVRADDRVPPAGLLLVGGEVAQPAGGTASRGGRSSAVRRASSPPWSSGR